MAFNNCKQLRYAELNEGLEVLGDEYKDEGGKWIGMVFAGSGLESIRIPSTLKVIELQTFFECKKLKSVEFSEGLEEIRPLAFASCGVKNIVLPSSTKVVRGRAFE